MLLRILKNDLSHRKVTNIILLLFIAMAAMFISGSVNSIATIMSAQGDYFDKAGMYDSITMLRDAPDGDILEKEAKNFEHSGGYIREKHLVLPASGIKKENTGEEFDNITILSAAENLGMKIYTDDNKELSAIDDGTLYIPQKTVNTGKLSIGDRITVTFGSNTVEMTVGGVIKDAVFGSSFVGVNRFFTSKNDYDKLAANADPSSEKCSLMGFTTSDTDALAREVAATNVSTLAQVSRQELEMSCIMDLIIAAIFLVVSFTLIIISFIVLNFTIKFTLDQEFREIGVMKAIGVADRKTEGMYLAKYIFLAIVGGVIGFIGGIPFGNMLISSSAGNTVIEGRNPYIVNVACVLLVILIVVLFCRGRVKSLRKFTPVDAVRSGNNGETYSKKSRISLSKTILRPTGYLSVTDILSNKKTFIVMAVTFTLCLLIGIVVIDTTNTLRSDSMVSWMSMRPSDVFMSSNEQQQGVMNENGYDIIRDVLADVDEKLDENGMGGDVYCEIGFHYNYKKDDVVYNAFTVQGVGTKADNYTYLRGTPPQNENEIAVTPQVAGVLDVDIGDTVTLVGMDGEHEMLVTAMFQTMMNMGNGVRLHEDMKVNYLQSAGSQAIQIDFDDNPDKKEIEKRFDKLREIFPEYAVRTGDEYIDNMIGVASMLEKVEIVLLPILLIVCMLVTILMERSLIARDKSEIAMLKATGFSDGFIIRRDMLRTAIVMLISTLIAVPLSTPFAQISSAFGFKTMGAQSIDFVIRPLEAFVILPLVFLTVTLTAVFFTALSTKKITANQTAGIE